MALDPHFHSLFHRSSLLFSSLVPLHIPFYAQTPLPFSNSTRSHPSLSPHFHPLTRTLTGPHLSLSLSHTHIYTTMLKTTTPSRTPIYSSAPLSNSHSPSPSLDNASQAIAAATGQASWDTLRKEVRQIETEIESKLTTLSKLAVRNGLASVPPQASAPGVPGAGSAAANGEDLEANIEELLEKVRPTATGLQSTIFSVQYPYRINWISPAVA